MEIKRGCLQVVLVPVFIWSWFFVYNDKLKQMLMPGYEPNQQRFTQNYFNNPQYIFDDLLLISFSNCSTQWW